MTGNTDGHAGLESQLVFSPTAPGRAWMLVLHHGADLLSALTGFVSQNGIRGGSLSGIGALSSAELAFFDRTKSDYLPIPVPEQTECLSMNGTIGISEDGKPLLHLHCTLGRRDGSVIGGHVLRAEVWPTLEIMLLEGDSALPKITDPASGLKLFSFA